MRKIYSFLVKSTAFWHIIRLGLLTLSNGVVSVCLCVCTYVCSGHSFLKACTAMFIVLNGHYGGSLSALF